MKKRHGLARALPAIPLLELEQWTTGGLLARLERLRRCEESPGASDLTPEEIALAADLILFKSDKAWQSAYRDLKQVLARRENVDRKI